MASHGSRHSQLFEPPAKVPQLLATYAGEFVVYLLQHSDTVWELAIWGLCSLVPRPPPRFYPHGCEIIWAEAWGRG